MRSAASGKGSPGTSAGLTGTCCRSRESQASRNLEDTIVGLRTGDSIRWKHLRFGPGGKHQQRFCFSGGSAGWDPSPHGGAHPIASGGLLSPQVVRGRLSVSRTGVGAGGRRSHWCRLVLSQRSLEQHCAARCTVIPLPAAFLEAREYSSLAEGGGGLESPEAVPKPCVGGSSPPGGARVSPLPIRVVVGSRLQVELAA